MKCFIYKSLKKDGLYLYLDKEDDFSALPDILLSNVGKLAFVMSLELTPERKLARENSQKVLDCIKEKGFFIQMPLQNQHLD